MNTTDKETLIADYLRRAWRAGRYSDDPDWFLWQQAYRLLMELEGVYDATVD